MYYDVLMKNTCFVLGFCLCAGWTWAQSTCETRVDAHQQASTVQRVHYCLMDDQEGAAAHNPAMVFSGVSSPKEQPAVQQPTKRDEALARPGAFKTSRVNVSKELVPTRQFPKLDDGRVSQQEIYAKQKALLDGKKMAQEAVAQSECAMPEQEVEAVRRPALKQMTDTPALAAKPARKTKRAHKKTIAKTVVETKQPQKVQETAPADSVLADVLDEPAPQGQDIAVGTATYAPAGQDIPVGTASYAPVEIAYDEYVPVEAEEIPVGTATYAPAN